jgi:GxxExxY protein
VQRQVALPIVYKSIRLDCGYRLDVIVENQVIIEIKAVERLISVHEAQMLSYMKLSGIRIGLLLNFNSAVLKDGIRRLTLKE